MGGEELQEYCAVMTVMVVAVRAGVVVMKEEMIVEELGVVLMGVDAAHETQVHSDGSQYSILPTGVCIGLGQSGLRVLQNGKGSVVGLQQRQLAVDGVLREVEVVGVALEKPCRYY